MVVIRGNRRLSLRELLLAVTYVAAVFGAFRLAHDLGDRALSGIAILLGTLAAVAGLYVVMAFAIGGRRAVNPMAIMVLLIVFVLCLMNLPPQRGPAPASPRAIREHERRLQELYRKEREHWEAQQRKKQDLVEEAEAQAQ